MKRIAIIGAAGYVGLELARQIRNGDYEVNAIVRDNGRFLLRDSGFNFISPSELGKETDRVDVVVNLAYPTSGPEFQYPSKNLEILNIIDSLMGPDSRLIHVSTAAVFGFNLERPVVVGPVPCCREYPYIESKIELENLILKRFKGQNIQIVRFGNVWGAGSSAWTASIANKILFSQPVGVQDIDGYCNATDVVNAASFLACLIEKSDSYGIQFFHLAEFAECRWSTWIQRIEEVLKQKAFYVPNMPYYPSSLLQEVWRSVSPVKPLSLWNQFNRGRFSASWTRTLVRRFGEVRYENFKKKYKAQQPLPTGYLLELPDELFLTILSTKNKFETSVPREWKPVLDFEESWSRVELWMHSAGYTR